MKKSRIIAIIITIAITLSGCTSEVAAGRYIKSQIEYSCNICDDSITDNRYGQCRSDFLPTGTKVMIEGTIFTVTEKSFCEKTLEVKLYNHDGICRCPQTEKRMILIKK